MTPLSRLQRRRCLSFEWYDEPLRRLVEVGLRRSVANGLWTCADNIVYNTSMVAVVIMAGGALTTGRISAEQVTQFVMYADWMAYNMWCAGGHWATLMDSIGACHRVFQLLDLPHPEQLNQGHGECACTDWMAYNMWCAGGHWATLMDSIGACHRVFQLLDLPHPEQLATQGRGECECTGIGVRSMACAGDHWATLMDSIGACHQVFQLLDLPNPKHVTQGHDECACVHGSQGRVLPSLSGKLEFRDLSFRYPTRPEALVLEGISLTIQPGELVALVGHNGSGKSTLLRLLQRLYEPTEGQVLIDDVPLPEVDIAWLRSHIGVVSQEPLLFSRDVASNIAYGSSKELSRQDIVQAATQANAHQFISELPEGYDTVVDNARLSGGQKQRIAIARALVRDPTLLFLDEATSALDAESEHYVQMALNQVIHDDSHASGGRRQTRVVIAHRLSTIRSADRIVVVSHGKIIERRKEQEGTVDMNLGRVYGSAFPAQLHMERQILSKFKRLPGLPSSHLGLHSMMGTLDELAVEDVVEANSMESPQLLLHPPIKAPYPDERLLPRGITEAAVISIDQSPQADLARVSQGELSGLPVLASFRAEDWDLEQGEPREAQGASAEIPAGDRSGAVAGVGDTGSLGIDALSAAARAGSDDPRGREEVTEGNRETGRERRQEADVETLGASRERGDHEERSSSDDEGSSSGEDDVELSHSDSDTTDPSCTSDPPSTCSSAAIIACFVHGGDRPLWPFCVDARRLWWYWRALLLLVVALVLYGASLGMAWLGKIGDALLVPCPVWPTSGLALYAVLVSLALFLQPYVFGMGTWPGIFLGGALLVYTGAAWHLAEHLSTLQIALASLTIAAFLTASVLCLSFFLTRVLHRLRPHDLTPLDRVKDIFLFALFSFLVSLLFEGVVAVVVSAWDADLAGDSVAVAAGLRTLGTFTGIMLTVPLLLQITASCLCCCARQPSQEGKEGKEGQEGKQGQEREEGQEEEEELGAVESPRSEANSVFASSTRLQPPLGEQHGRRRVSLMTGVGGGREGVGSEADLESVGDTVGSSARLHTPPSFRTLPFPSHIPSHPPHSNPNYLSLHRPIHYHLQKLLKNPLVVSICKTLASLRFWEFIFLLLLNAATAGLIFSTPAAPTTFSTTTTAVPAATTATAALPYLLFPGDTASGTVLQVQVLVLVLSLGAVLLAAAVRDTRRLREGLRQLNLSLEGEVARRTEQMQAVNEVSEGEGERDSGAGAGGGAELGAVLLAAAVRDPRRLREGLRQLNLSLEGEDLKRSKEEFGGGRAGQDRIPRQHEPRDRTPIHGIIGMTALALDALESLHDPHDPHDPHDLATHPSSDALALRNDLTVELHEHLTVVAQSADCLLNIANTVLDLARIEAGQLALDKVPFALRDVVGSTMRMLQVRAEQKQLLFSWQVAEGVPHTLVGDPGRLQQCIINLGKS
ncbi:unnamed protein product [Closterium sp. NIES-64]|nr:unnamed protein product [Closterium sp. NIES-64]